MENIFPGAAEEVKVSERNSGEVILAFLLGGMIGAAVGTLFAPTSGKETRKKLKTIVDEISEKTEDFIEEGKGKVEDIISEAKERFAHKKKEQA